MPLARRLTCPARRSGPLADDSRHAAEPGLTPYLETDGFQACEHSFGRQAQLSVAADTRFPCIPRALVQDVVNDHGVLLIFEEAGEDAAFVAVHRNESRVT